MIKIKHSFTIIEDGSELYHELIELSKNIKPLPHNKKDEVVIGSSHKNLMVVKIDSGYMDRGKVVYCKCKCGRFLKIGYFNYKNHSICSCGCLPHGYKHVESRDRLYGIWQNMNYRCCNENDTSYYKYGGKGIKVCSDWDITNSNGFVNFSKWAHSHGYSDELTIDRIDEQLGYFPENCRWATFLEQNTHLAMLKTNKSGYKGVSWDKVNHQWLVVISINNKSYHIGRYNTKKEAVEARNKYIDMNHLLHKKQVYIGENGYVNGKSY